MKLLGEYKLGNLNLNNRIVMAPMTRARAPGNIPNALMVEYYEQRASAGLIITEGTSPSPNGLGYAKIPGIFTREQALAWKQVTDAVHVKGGKIFVQLMHTGRASHKINLPKNAKVLAPSAIINTGKVWTEELGFQPISEPTAMTLQDIEDVKDEFVESAKLAVQVAGFDGVELHGANGYLIDQFLNTASNKREDSYGKDRTKFAVEITERVADAIGKDKVGFRISPYGTFNDMEIFEDVDGFYQRLAGILSQVGIAYLHVIDHGKGEVKRLVREVFKGTYILSTGYDIEKAEVDLLENKGDLVAFGRAFISNPDLVERIKLGLELSPGDPSTFYGGEVKGYTDYPKVS